MKGSWSVTQPPTPGDELLRECVRQQQTVTMAELYHQQIAVDRLIDKAGLADSSDQQKLQIAQRDSKHRTTQQPLCEGRSALSRADGRLANHLT